MAKQNTTKTLRRALGALAVAGGFVGVTVVAYWIIQAVVCLMFLISDTFNLPM